MEDIIRVLSKAISSTLLAGIPGGNVVFKIVEGNIDATIDKIYKSKDPHPIRDVADKIAESILNTPGIDRSSPGAALAACRDMMSSIARSELSYERLIELEFDSDKVSEIILSQKFYDYDYASSQRRAIWEHGIRQFSAQLCQTIPTIPEIGPLMLTHIIRLQKQILRKLDA